MRLFRYTHNHQIQTPWGETMASFEEGSGLIKSIALRDDGVVVVSAEKDGRGWTIAFTASGYGHDQQALHMCEQFVTGEGICGQQFPNAAALSAHKRSHKVNHKGQDELKAAVEKQTKGEGL